MDKKVSPPAWAAKAGVIISEKGWHHSDTYELLIARRFTKTQVAQYRYENESKDAPVATIEPKPVDMSIDPERLEALKALVEDSIPYAAQEFTIEADAGPDFDTFDMKAFRRFSEDEELGVKVDGRMKIENVRHLVEAAWAAKNAE